MADDLTIGIGSDTSGFERAEGEIDRRLAGRDRRLQDLRRRIEEQEARITRLGAALRTTALQIGRQFARAGLGVGVQAGFQALDLESTFVGRATSQTLFGFAFGGLPGAATVLATNLVGELIRSVSNFQESFRKLQQAVQQMQARLEAGEKASRDADAAILKTMNDRAVEDRAKAEQFARELDHQTWLALQAEGP